MKKTTILLKSLLIALLLMLSLLIAGCTANENPPVTPPDDEHVGPPAPEEEKEEVVNPLDVLADKIVPSFVFKWGKNEFIENYSLFSTKYSCDRYFTDADNVKVTIYFGVDIGGSRTIENYLKSSIYYPEAKLYWFTEDVPRILIKTTEEPMTSSKYIIHSTVDLNYSETEHAEIQFFTHKEEFKVPAELFTRDYGAIGFEIVVDHCITSDGERFDREMSSVMGFVYKKLDDGRIALFTQTEFLQYKSWFVGEEGPVIGQ